MVMLSSPLHGHSRALTAHHHWNQSTSDWFDCGFYFGEDVPNTHSPDKLAGFEEKTRKLTHGHILLPFW